MTSSRDIVLSFIANVALCERALMTEFAEVSRESATAPLKGRNNEGARQSGRIDGFGAYGFHGAGCRFDLDSDEDVDFDWRNGVAVFDPWRLVRYAESIGVVDADKQSFLAACRELVAEGLLEEGEYKFFRVRT